VRTGFEPVLRSIVRDHREGVTTTVAVTETTFETRAPGASLTAFALRVNGKPDASLTVLHSDGEPPTRGTPLPAGDMETQVLCGALPAFLEGPAGDALVVGWGSGVTVAMLAAVVPGRVVAVELEPEVVRAARPFAAVVPCDRRRVDLVLEDARNLLLLDDRRYAVVVSEPSNPWVAGASTLFTEDFFRLVRRRLRRGGTFVQWLQAYEIAPRTVRAVLAALTRVFPSVTVLRMVHSPGDLLLVCGDRPPRFRASPGVLPELVRRMGIAGRQDIVARVVATTPRLLAFARGARPNTDDRPTVEFEAPLDLVRFRAWGSDRVVRAIVGPRAEVLAAAVPDRARFIRALLDAGRPEAALGLGASGDLARAARAMRAARALADEDAHDELPVRLAAARAAPEDRARRAAVADAYFALGYPERATALYLGPLAP
jgi:SAM-dependent methyltransferase